jgi:hypothetical protein
MVDDTRCSPITNSARSPSINFKNQAGDLAWFKFRLIIQKILRFNNVNARCHTTNQGIRNCI